MTKPCERFLICATSPTDPTKHQSCTVASRRVCYHSHCLACWSSRNAIMQGMRGMIKVRSVSIFIPIDYCWSESMWLGEFRLNNRCDVQAGHRTKQSRGGTKIDDETSSGNLYFHELLERWFIQWTPSLMQWHANHSRPFLWTSNQTHPNWRWTFPNMSKCKLCLSEILAQCFNRTPQKRQHAIVAYMTK